MPILFNCPCCLELDISALQVDVVTPMCSQLKYEGVTARESVRIPELLKKLFELTFQNIKENYSQITKTDLPLRKIHKTQLKITEQALCFCSTTPHKTKQNMPSTTHEMAYL